jgi:hypothetical protein
MKRALLLILIAAPAFAQSWYDNYNRGVAAVRAKNYAAGAEALQAAIREQPTESAKLRAEKEFITYLPHMWLGIARAGMNEPDAALAEFRIAEEQGVVQGTPFYAQMKSWAAEAQEQKKETAQKAAQKDAVAPRREAQTAIGRAVAAQSDAQIAGAEQGDAYRNGGRKLQEAYDAFNHAGIDVRAYNRARDLAVQARELFAGATEQAKREKKPPPPNNEFVVPFPAAERPKPAPVPQPQPPQPPPPQAVTQPPPQQPASVSASLAAARVAVQNYKRRLIEARQPVLAAASFERALAGTPDQKTIARVTAQVAEHERRLEAQLKPKPVELPPAQTTATQPPPAAVDTRPELEAAYRAYAGGDFAGSETLLTAAIAKSATAEAYALRACSRYTRAMLSRTPEALLPSAAADFREALRLNAALRLGDGAFSPKLVAFFEAVRRGQ